MHRIFLLLVTICTVGLSSTVRAQEAGAGFAGFPTSIFFFGGPVVDADLGNSLVPFAGDLEKTLLFGAGAQRFLHDSRLLPGLSLGFEAGLAARLTREGSGRDSAELWGGAVARYDRLVLFDTLRVTPAFTFGLTAVTDTLPGRESRQEKKDDGNAALLVHLGPEIAFSSPRQPHREMFYRVHHRSGAFGTFGDMRGALNANVFGLRVRF